MKYEKSDIREMDYVVFGNLPKDENEYYNNIHGFVADEWMGVELGSSPESTEYFKDAVVLAIIRDGKLWEEK